LSVADAENLPFIGNSFDAVYSWGVIHHSPDTSKAVEEIYRVLKPGGIAKIMIYHKNSIIGFMLWNRYGLFRLKPFMSLEKIYANYLESPGTKAYSRLEARHLFEKFIIKKMNTPLNHGDLLSSNVGQRHRGTLLSIAKKIWPRFLLRKFFPNNGLELMIEVMKPDDCANLNKT